MIFWPHTRPADPEEQAKQWTKAPRTTSAFAILACRAWVTRREPAGIRLASLYLPYTWTIGVNEASCLEGWSSFKHKTQSPEPGCADGFWGLNRASEVDTRGVRPHAVRGLVYLWGRVLVGTRGYRAGKAKIAALIAPGGPTSCGLDDCDLHAPDIVETLAIFYDVPCLPAWPHEILLREVA